MSATKPSLNVSALICACLMVVSCFLPWSQVSSSASVMGFSSSFRQSYTGIQLGLGVIPAFLGIVCIIMVFLRARFMFIPGVAVLLFALVPLTGLGNFSSSSAYGEAHTSTGFGVYVLLLSCIGYILSSMFLSKKRQQQSFASIQTNIPVSNSSLQEEALPKPVSVNPIPDSVIEDSNKTEKEQIAKPFEVNTPPPPIPAPVPVSEKTKKLSRFQKGLIIAGIIIGTYAILFQWADSSSKKQMQERTQKEQAERQRIEQIIEKVNEAVSNHQYELALSSVNSIAWTLDNNTELIGQYEAQRENLKATIQSLKHERDSLEQVQNTIDMEIALRKDSIWNAEQAASQQDNDKFPYVASVIVNRTFIYKEPDINSDRETVLIIKDLISVMARQNEFLFCKATQGDGNTVSGWVLYKDVEKY